MPASALRLAPRAARPALSRSFASLISSASVPNPLHDCEKFWDLRARKMFSLHSQWVEQALPLPTSWLRVNTVLDAYKLLPHLVCQQISRLKLRQTLRIASCDATKAARHESEVDFWRCLQ